MVTINPKEVPVPLFHSYLLGAITPRPIALTSSIDKMGNVNLSPFSFFNCFGANPPVLIFSPARRVRDNTTKHTYDNILEVPEVVIHMVNYSMVQQTSLASTEYPKNVNEFDKAGFTSEPSMLVRPPRVKEAPVAMECKVLQVIQTGEKGGAGNLVICEVLLMHLQESILTGGKIDPVKLDAVSRLGGDWYARINAANLFSVAKPLEKVGIGIDQLPPSIRNSKILSGNDLGILANVVSIPALNESEVLRVPNREEKIHAAAKKLIEENKVMEAWKVLLSGKAE
jgi:flavin reductase (DIM6/NTAB) family NADH-FMN oxidoreductase RutF